LTFITLEGNPLLFFLYRSLPALKYRFLRE
jgi:hypothetical protein